MAKTPAPPQAPPPEAPPMRRASLKVRATQLGYYEHIRRREGDVFKLVAEAHFTPSWMTYVDPRTPERVTSGPEALKNHHDEMLASRYAPSGSMHEADDDNPLGG